MDVGKMNYKFFRTFIAALVVLQLFGCQATNFILDKSDSYVAEKVTDLSDKDVCSELQKNYGPKTKDTLRGVVKKRRLDCTQIASAKKSEETPEQREVRINQAIQLLNNAAQIGSQTNMQNQPSTVGLNCNLVGQSQSGVFKNCAYSCGSGVYYKTIGSADICPLSALR